MSARDFWRELQRGLTELVFPPLERCAVCDRDALRPTLALCRDCLRRLPFLAPPLCSRCGRLLRLCAARDGACRECARERFFFSRARAVCLYEGAARAYLHEVKFHRSLPLARALAGVLAAYVREQGGFQSYEAILPVPLHARREAERGFNQAAVLAGAVGAVLHRPVVMEAAARIRQTETQSRLDRERRRENVKAAFSIVDPGAVTGRRVLLIDDILTTGYTASECARALLRAGAVEVGVLTLANGVLEDQWLTDGSGGSKRTNSS
ncbi:MAG: ComF family protein [Bacteroidota bacterium]